MIREDTSAQEEQIMQHKKTLEENSWLFWGALKANSQVNGTVIVSFRLVLFSFGFALIHQKVILIGIGILNIQLLSFYV